MPVKLRTLKGQVPPDVELQIRDLVMAVNQLEAKMMQSAATPATTTAQSANAQMPTPTTP
jgi:hypothetical protein